MVRNDRCKALEPKKRERRQNFAFARDSVGHDAVESGNAIGGDKQQPVAEVEHFTDLAAFYFGDAWEINLEQWFVQHGTILNWRAEISKRKNRFSVVLLVTGQAAIVLKCQRSTEAARRHGVHYRQFPYAGSRWRPWGRFRIT